MMFTALQAKNANYACAALSLVILLIRVAASQRRHRPRDLSFWLVVSSIFVIIVRIIVVYFYLLYGTASDALAHEHYFDTQDLSRIRKGSILSLAARVLITASCWLQICLLLLFYKQILNGIRWALLLIKFTWVATVATFIAVVFATFLECRPLQLYWQVDPHPGSCVKGYVQLLVQCISNISIDILLLAISYPILFCKGRSWQQHARVGILFTLGSFCIIVTSLRMISVYDTRSAQPTRSLWASVQMIVSTFVANAPTIYGDLQVTKRIRSDTNVRRKSRPETWTRSDSEAGYPDMPMPARAKTGESNRSSRKEWFDHLQDVDEGQAVSRATSIRSMSPNQRV